MNVTIRLKGQSPLLMHNVQLSDPDNEWSRRIAEISGKKKKTEEDRLMMSELEWYGGLILAPGIVDGPAWKTEALRKCFINAAKVTRQGTQIGRALLFEAWAVPLQYDGPRNLKELFAAPGFVSRLSVRVGSARIIRTRPQFFPWVVQATALLDESVMAYDNLCRIIELAGRAEGIGDNRVNGYGRFSAEVIKTNGK